jgi:glycosyltransferase involved in cell wall biosynthesis
MRATGRLVSVGIPTYNRCDRLRSAVRSVLDQDYPDLEIIISDNASTDGTESYVAALIEQHPDRVRYLRNDENLGPLENFNRVRAACTGEFVMWLGDDDRLSPTFVSTCVGLLDEHPDAVLAAGLVRYVDADGLDVGTGEVIVCDQADPVDRVLAYYRQVGDNGTFYGVTRAEAARALQPLATVMGSDWFLMAEIAYLGKVLVAEGAEVRRSVGGATRSLKHVAATLRFSWFEGEFPQLAIAWWAFRAIGWRSPVYGRLGSARRLVLGLRVAAIVVTRFVVPAVPRYGRLLLRRVGGGAAG